MKLHLENIGKISNADIDINGITVIAGKNNTGKSTVGKVLFAFFESFYNIDEKVLKLKKNESFRVFINSLLDFDRSFYKRFFGSSLLEHDMRADFYLLVAPYFGDIENESPFDFESFSMKYGLPDTEETRKFFEKAIESVTSRNDSLIKKSIISDSFKNVFNNQICNMNCDKDSKVVVTIKDTTFEIVFRNNDVVVLKEGIEHISHEAILIDDPNIIDKQNFRYPRRYASNIQQLSLLKKIDNQKFKEKMDLSSFDAREKMKELLCAINDVAQGEFILNNDIFMFKEKGNNEATNLLNLSLGLKSFILLKQLIENEGIKENDFIILDEPEVHLHPEWQIKFAEIIIRLQKTYDLNIVLTTHSRDFLDAIELYSKKLEISDKCSYYISCENNDKTILNNLKDDPIEIYRQLIQPSDILDKLRFELEDKTND